MKFPCCSLSLVLLLISAPADARSAGSAIADDLPRHGIAGLEVAAADSAKPEDSQSNPPTVKKVVTERGTIYPADFFGFTRKSFVA